ncbi:MAG: alanine--tRNA ligase [Clostridiales bacterium]|nr:alanine--tRNA ligase [Clostridiales bacterium]
MRSMGLNEIREKYLSFFESKGHLRLPSFSLIPQNEKSLLLINAGMAPMKPWFSGEQTPPRRRVTTCQKCIRTPDIERVGHTARHGTFFEMLGNFSFGDYFKRDAAAWAWEFCTKVMELPKERLFVSVYLEDDEAWDIWTKEVGVAEDHMVRFGKEDNFWEIGAGPCGPCSEIYFDRGEEFGCGKPGCKVGCDCDRYVEFWNLVFTQFNNDGNGNYTTLPQKNIDTGMGLERLACIMQGVSNIFEVDTIRNTMKHVTAIAGKEYHCDEKTDVSLRVVTDHIRSTTMLVSDGVLPSNEGRGYVLRRLLRRAARHGRLLGITEPFLYKVASTVISESASAYPELREKEDYIVRVIRTEEERFAATIDAGLGIFAEMLERTKAGGKAVFSGEDAFRLYDTYGFPVDLTIELLDEAGIGLDREGFDALMTEQKERSRAATAAAGDFGWAGQGTAGIEKETDFLGYTEKKCDGEVVFIIADGESRGSISAGDEATLVLDCTPFYAESGGQVSDMGVITGGNGGVFEVTSVKKTADKKWLHSGRVVSGTFGVTDKVTAAIDVCRRAAVSRAHSATHLLQGALRQVLGSHVNQAGSYVEPDRLRFDFTHFSAVTSDELAEVENIVNEKILAGLGVSVSEMAIDEARSTGAMALFGEKYGDIVRVVKMGDFSTELCGGTHLDNTAKAGLFRIVSESSVAAGVRRIEAVVGLGVAELLNGERETIDSVCAELKASRTELVRKAAQLSEELKAAKREIERLSVVSLKADFESAAASAADVGGVKLAVCHVSGVPVELVRKLGDEIRGRGDALTALFAVTGEKPVIAAFSTKKAIAAGLKAGDLVKAVAKLAGGNGGGRPDSATAGARDSAALEKALESAAEIASGLVK